MSAEVSEDEFASWEPLFDTGDDIAEGLNEGIGVKSSVAVNQDKTINFDNEIAINKEDSTTGSGPGDNVEKENSDHNLQQGSEVKDANNIKDRPEGFYGIDSHEDDSADSKEGKERPLLEPLTITSDNTSVSKDDSVRNDQNGGAISNESNQVQSPSFLNSMFATFKSESKNKSSNQKQDNDNNTINTSSSLPNSPIGSMRGQDISSPTVITHRRQTSTGSRRKFSRNRKASNDSLMNVSPSPLQKSQQPIELTSRRNRSISAVSDSIASSDTNDDDIKTNIPEKGEESDLEGNESIVSKQTTTTTASVIGDNDDSYDHKRFTEEKYENTEFHYAINERNNDFHSIFENIPTDDRLIDDFSCALSKDFLYQGRIYVSERNLCFKSNILGWVSKEIIPLQDIRYMEKTSSAGLFPSAILIETNDERSQYNNFISRDKAFSLIKEVWSRNLLNADLDHEKPSKLLTSYKSGGNDENENENEKQDYNINTSVIDLDEKISSSIFYKFRDGVKYNNESPYTSNETEFPTDQDEPNEFILTTLDLSCSPLQAYQIIFSNDNYSFLHDFLKSTDAFDIEDPDPFVDNKREYQYEKNLSYPGGPKSTTCFAEESIEHYDKNGYIMIISTTKTPNVPSGKVFSTKTRYMFRWGNSNNCQLRVSFWVHWTGSSWFKKMIESGCKKGQIDATEKLTDILERYIEENIISSEGPIPISLEGRKLGNAVMNEKVPPTKIATANISVTEESNISRILLLVGFIVMSLLLVDIYYQLSLKRSISNVERLLLEMKVNR